MINSQLDVRNSQGPNIGTTGPITQYFGYTPEQFAQFLAIFVNVVRVQPEVRLAAAAVKANFDNARKQIMRMSVYKDMHDLLQQLELSYHIVHELIYDNSELIATEQVHWRGLVSCCSALQTTILKLYNYAQLTTVTTDDWIQELYAEQTKLRLAHERRDIILLDDTITAIYDVISQQMSRINDQLIGAIDILNLSELVAALQHVYKQLTSPPPTTDVSSTYHLNELNALLGSLSQLAVQLAMLRNQHDQWQQLDTIMRSEQALLGLSLPTFKRRWTKSLMKKLRAQCEGIDEEWSRCLEILITDLNISLDTDDLASAIQLFYECRSTVIQRCNQVDHDLKLFCGLLQAAGGPLDSIVDILG